MDVVLKDAKGILDELQAYKGAGAEIREVHPEKHPSSVVQTRGAELSQAPRKVGGAAVARRENSCCHVVWPSSETGLEENTYGVNLYLKATNPHRRLKKEEEVHSI